MRKLIFAIMALTFITGCTTLPGPVDERYLAEKTDNDAARLEMIEKEIISKNREKQAAEQNRKENTPDIENTKKVLSLITGENRLLKDQLELYTRSKDARNMEIKKEQLAENEEKLERQKKLLKYEESQKNLYDTEAELRNAELAVLVAKLNFEKSKIAEAYREKTEPVDENEEKGFFSKIFKRDSSDRFGYKKYRTHLDKMKKNEGKSLKRYNKAKAAYDASKKELNTPAAEGK